MDPKGEESQTSCINKKSGLYPRANYKNAWDHIFYQNHEHLPWLYVSYHHRIAHPQYLQNIHYYQNYDVY